MNKEFILFNLKEAKESIENIIQYIENQEDYCNDDGYYIVDMQHLFWHINTAWNARNSSPKDSEECTEENFEKWNEFPTDLIMNY